jgi:YD repeat-containing protein
LRWALVESAWRLVRSSPKWAAMYARLKERKGKKRAIVAVARRLLCVLYAMLRTRTPYRIVTTETKAPRPPRKRLVLVRMPTAESTTTAETGPPRTTRKTSTRTPTADQTTTTRDAAGRPTRKRLVKASTATQTTIA